MKFCIATLDRIILNLGINYTIGVAHLDCLLGFYGNKYVVIFPNCHNQLIPDYHFVNLTSKTPCSSEFLFGTWDTKDYNLPRCD